MQWYKSHMVSSYQSAVDFRKWNDIPSQHFQSAGSLGVIRCISFFECTAPKSSIAYPMDVTQNQIVSLNLDYPAASSIHKPCSNQFLYTSQEQKVNNINFIKPYKMSRWAPNFKRYKENTIPFLTRIDWFSSCVDSYLWKISWLDLKKIKKAFTTPPKQRNHLYRLKWLWIKIFWMRIYCSWQNTSIPKADLFEEFVERCMWSSGSLMNENELTFWIVNQFNLW